MDYLNIISDELATDSTSGSITTNGGIGVGGNIFVNKDVSADTIHSRHNLYVNNDIISTNIIPDNLNICYIGKDYAPWDYIYANSIDINNDVSLGKNRNGEPLIKIDKNIPETLILNSDLVSRDKNGTIFFYVNQSNNCVSLNNMRVNDHVIYDYNVIDINGDTQYIKPSKSFNIINVNNPINCVVDVKTNSLKHGSLIRLIVKHNTVKLSINRNIYHIRHNDWIEFLYINDKLEYIGGNIIS